MSARLPRAIAEQLDRIPSAGLFWNPLRGLRRARTLPGELDTFMGERQDGALELVRRGVGEAGLELVLNERLVASEVLHAGLVPLRWAARTAETELALGFEWRAALEPTYPLDLRWLLRSFTAVCRAVAALHGKGWVHADLKPEALAFSEDPEATRVWDLRIAQRSGPRRFEAFSARFAAPEQVTGGEVDPRTDVYALGVTLYSLFIRGRFPSIVVGRRRPGVSDDDDGPSLSPITCFGGVQGDTARPDRPAAGGGVDAQATLGAKVLFAAELERVIRRTTDIAVAHELLRLIERATAHAPRERFADAAALATATAELLSLAEEAGPASS